MGRPKLTCCGLLSLRSATALILVLNLVLALAASVVTFVRMANAPADWEWLGGFLDGLDMAFAEGKLGAAGYASYSGYVRFARDSILGIYSLGERFLTG